MNYIFLFSHQVVLWNVYVIALVLVYKILFKKKTKEKNCFVLLKNKTLGFCMKV